MRVVLAPEDRSPRHARALVAEILRNAGMEHLLDDALLLVSELVTNAVIHAGTQITVDGWVEGAALTVEVSDGRPDGVRLGVERESTSTHGRGFQLIEALAAGWGTNKVDTGKTVWFRLGDTHGALRPVAPAAGRGQAPRRDIAFLLGPPDLEQRLPVQAAVGELLRRTVEGLGRQRGWIYSDAPGRASGGPWAVFATYDDVAAPDPDSVRRGPSAPGGSTRVAFLGADGEAAGALVLSGSSADEEEHALVRLAAQRIGAILRDERAQSAAGRSRGSLALLVEASEMLAGVLDVRLAATLTAHLTVPRLACWSAVWTTFGSEIELVAVAHSSEQAAAGLEDALREPANIAGLADLAGRGSTRWLAENSGGAVMSFLDAGLQHLGEGWLVPLYGRRRILGLLAVAESPDSTPGDPALLTNLGRIAALALDNARLYCERAAIAADLQAALLPAGLPCAVGVEFGARYAAGGDGTEVGGDFYDVFELGDGSWGVAIGDVCGKGAAAASITGGAREVLRVLLRSGVSPTGALARLHESLMGMGDRRTLCTVIAGVLRREHPELVMELAVAGHPPPVLLRADGSTEMLTHGGTVLGVINDINLSEAQVRLAPGDALVLYTDGVTERRGPDGMFGEDKLLETLRAAAGCGANELAEAVHRASQGHGGDAAPHDDVAVLVIRAAVIQAKNTISPLFLDSFKKEGKDVPVAVITDIPRLLRGASLRVTRPRVAVLSVVHANPHTDTDSIIRTVRTELPGVSHQAVYDSLATLTAVGLLRRIQPAGLVARYESRVGDNHHHVVCRACGVIADVDCAVGDTPCLTASENHGYSLDEAEVIYWGLCPSCSPSRTT